MSFDTLLDRYETAIRNQAITEQDLIALQEREAKASGDVERLETVNNDLMKRLVDLEQEHAEAEPRLQALYSAAKEVLKETTRPIIRKRTAAFALAVTDLKKALDAAHDHCGQVPF